MILLLKKLGSNELYNLDRFFFRFVTMHAFDRQTDRQTDGWTPFSRLDRPAFNAAR